MTNSTEIRPTGDSVLDLISNCSTEQEIEPVKENLPGKSLCRSPTLVDIKPAFFPEKIGGTFIDSVLALDSNVSPLTNKRLNPNQNLIYKKLIDRIDLQINKIILEKKLLSELTHKFIFFKKHAVINMQTKIIAELTLLKQIINTIAKHAACIQDNDINQQNETLLYAIKLFLKISNSKNTIVAKKICKDENINLSQEININSKYRCLEILNSLSVALDDIKTSESPYVSEDFKKALTFLSVEIPLLKKCLKQTGKKYKRVLKKNS